MPSKKKCSSLKYSPSLSKLCTPSLLYFVISVVAIVILAIQNFINNDNSFCIGNYKCNLGNKTVIFVLHTIYILFWTFILDLMCKAGYSAISWFIVLIPFILLFLFFGIIISKQKNIEGNSCNKHN